MNGSRRIPRAGLLCPCSWVCYPQVVLEVKNPPASAGGAGVIPGSEDPLEEEIATHPSVLALKIPCTEEPGGVTKSWTQLSDRANTHTCHPPGPRMHSATEHFPDPCFVFW